MSAGFLTMTDGKYLALAKVLRDSLLRFSQYPLQIRTDNCHELREVRGRVQVQPFANRYGLPMTGYFLKYAACIESPFDCSVWVDSDCVANKHVDDLIEFAKAYREPAPLLCFHAGPFPDIYQCARALGIGCTYFRERRPMYNHACVIIFNRACRPFFQACADSYQKVKTFPGINDEILLNAMLLRRIPRCRLNCVALPRRLFRAYERGDARDLDYWEWTAGGFASSHFIHGEKRAIKARALFDALCAIPLDHALNRAPFIL